MRKRFLGRDLWFSFVCRTFSICQCVWARVAMIVHEQEKKMREKGSGSESIVSKLKLCAVGLESSTHCSASASGFKASRPKTEQCRRLMNLGTRNLPHNLFEKALSVCCIIELCSTASIFRLKAWN